MGFLEEISGKILVGDGAMGTLLHSRGIPPGSCFEELVLSNPELVSSIHREYIQAGADLIETNTYAANQLKLARHGFQDQVAKINWKAAHLAQQEIEKTERKVFLAGSVGPLSTGIPVEEQKALNFEELFQQQLGPLMDGGVDVIFFETFSNLQELQSALYMAQTLNNLPAICSMSFNEEGRTSDGIDIVTAFKALREAGAEVVGANCMLGPSAILNLLDYVEVDEDLNLAVFPNAGKPQFLDGRYFYYSAPQYFMEMTPKLVQAGARLIGGCCGTSPDTIRAIRKAVDELQLKPVGTKHAVRQIHRIEVSPVIADASTPSSRIAERPTIVELYKRGTVIITELDPPKTLVPEKMVEGAKALKEAGTDFITLADNSLAILRIHNISMGILIQQKTGMEPIIHMACRDRNVLGLQSELLGMAALGMHHVLALTGDPAKVGDHPGASSVYDVNSIGLLDIIRRLNEGMTQNGRSIKHPTKFIAGCAFNPNSRNLDAQLKRLQRKIEAGAKFIMTQPVFDPKLAKMSHETLKSTGLPVFVGVMPLLNSRNAEFLHNEVPGVVIPDPVRERMRAQADGDAAAEGLRIAEEISTEILQYFSGIYFITPLLRYDLTVHLSRFVRGLPGAAR